MLIEELLSLHCVKANVDCLSRKKILEFISNIAAEYIQDDPQQLFNRLFAREKLGSTSIGNQVAIPHCVTRKINKLVGVLVTLANPIDFSATDNLPVDVFFALFYPPGSSDYSSCLEKIGILLDNKEVLKELKTAQTDAELFDKIVHIAMNNNQEHKKDQLKKSENDGINNS